MNRHSRSPEMIYYFSEDLICDTLEGNFILFKTFSIFFLEIGLSQGNITKEELEEIFDFDLKKEVEK